MWWVLKMILLGASMRIANSYSIVAGGPTQLSLLDEDLKVVSTALRIGDLPFEPKSGLLGFKVSFLSPPFMVDEDRPGTVVRLNITDDGELGVEDAFTTAGDEPVHITQVGDIILIANYHSNSISSISTRDRYRINDVKGVGLNPYGTFVKGRGAFVPCKGSDEIHQFLLEDDGTLTPNGVITMMSNRSRAHIGPRHMAFDESDNAYILTEDSVEIHVYTIEENKLTTYKGVLPGLIPDKETGPLRPAEILYANDTLFCTTRKDADYYVPDYGLLTIIDLKSGDSKYVTVGRTPRSMAITPDGERLVIGYVHDNVVELFTNSGESIRSTFIAAPYAVAVWV